MAIYRNNATLGIGKLDYIIASGVKQKNIQDNFNLEQFLKLDQITPLQTSYTQTAEDRAGGSKQTGKDKESDIEPSEEESDPVREDTATEDK